MAERERERERGADTAREKEVIYVKNGFVYD